MSNPIYLILVGIIFLAFGILSGRGRFFPVSLIPAIVCFVWAGVVYWRGRQAVRKRQDLDDGPPELMGRDEIEKRRN